MIGETYRDYVPLVNAKIPIGLVQKDPPKFTAPLHHLFEADPDDLVNLLLVLTEQLDEDVIKKTGSPELVEIVLISNLVQFFRIVIDEPSLVLEQVIPLIVGQRDAVRFVIREKSVLPKFIVTDDAVLAVILEIHDDLRNLSGFDAAKRVNAKTDAHLVINVNIPDHTISLGRDQPPARQDAVDSGIILEDRPPADNLPIGIVFNFL
ncbi:MAG: hypothetical protein AB7S61_10025 [Methanoregulaceae archaeon]